MKLHRWPLIAAFLCLSNTLAMGQGPTCSSAQPIAGFGSFPLDTSAGTSTGHGLGTTCNPVVGLQYEGYFLWRAHEPGDVRFEFDSLPNVGHLAVFEGIGCNAVCVAKQRILHSSLTDIVHVDVTGVNAGDVYLIQIANYQGVPTVGDLRIGWQPCDPIHSQDDNFAPNGTCATAAPLPTGLHTGLWIAPGTPDFFRIHIPPIQEMTLELLPSFNAVQATYHEGDCTAFPGFGNVWHLVNRTSEPREIVFEVSNWLNVECATYDLSLDLTPLACAPASGVDDSHEDNDDCSSATLVTQGAYPDLFVSLEDPDFYAVDVSPGQKLDVQLITGLGTFRPSLLDDQCAWLGSDEYQWTNWSGQTQRRVLGVVGNLGGAEGCATYDMVIGMSPDPCLAYGLDVLEAWVSDREIANGFYPGLFAGSGDRYELCVAPGDTLTVDLDLVHADGIMEAALTCTGFFLNCWPGIDPPLATGSGQQFSLQWTNNEGQEEVVRLGLFYQQGTLYCNQYNMTVSGAGGCSESLQTNDFCPPSNPNSSGHTTKLMGTRRNATQSLYLDAVRGPVGQFGYLLVSTAAQTPGLPLGDGELCLALTGSNQLERYNQAGTALNSIGQFDSLGRFINMAGTSTGDFGFDVPFITPWIAPIVSGQTLYFQMWHRDVNGTSNLSNGVEVVF